MARNVLLTEVLGAPMLPGSSFVRWLSIRDARVRKHPNDRQLAQAHHRIAVQ